MDISTGLDEKGIREHLISGEWELRDDGNLPLIINIKTPSKTRLINSLAFKRMKNRKAIFEFKKKGNTTFWKLITKQKQLCEPDEETTIIRYTNRIKKDRYFSDLNFRMREALSVFPELKGKTITVGLEQDKDNKDEGFSIATANSKKYKLNINLFITMQHKALLNTIGWGLTHMVQVQEGKPNNEKHTDISLLARSPIFRDSRPANLKLPEKIEQDWITYKDQVGELCVKALEVRAKRKKDSHYITWLEKKIRKLAKKETKTNGA